MVDKLKIAVISAVHAYMEAENEPKDKFPDRMLNGWKMGGRRNMMERFNLPRRGGFSRVRLRGYLFL
ncbi:hypothetical protein J7M07_06015 [bacterium]|nr:hypothetical protein [bacterium]